MASVTTDDGKLFVNETDLHAGDVVVPRTGGREMVVLKVTGDVVFVSFDNQTSFSSCALYDRRDLVRLQVG